MNKTKTIIGVIISIIVALAIVAFLSITHIFINDKKVSEVYDVYIDGDLILTQTEYEFESSGTAKLFWTGYLNWYATAFKVYRFTIYKKEICVLNFIPCLDENNIPCMYDLVSQKPFYNQGSGTFRFWAYPFHQDTKWGFP